MAQQAVEQVGKHPSHKRLCVICDHWHYPIYFDKDQLDAVDPRCRLCLLYPKDPEHNQCDFLHCPSCKRRRRNYHFPDLSHKINPRCNGCNGFEKTKLPLCISCGIRKERCEFKSSFKGKTGKCMMCVNEHRRLQRTQEKKSNHPKKWNVSYWQAQAYESGELYQRIQQCSI